MLCSFSPIPVNTACDVIVENDHVGDSVSPRQRSITSDVFDNLEVNDVAMSSNIITIAPIENDTGNDDIVQEVNGQTNISEVFFGNTR